MSTVTALQTPPVQKAATLIDRAPLNAADRCDTCGAKAYVAAVVNGTELLYCGHHGTKYEQRLRTVATSWLDERPKLLEEARQDRAAAPVKRKR